MFVVGGGVFGVVFGFVFVFFLVLFVFRSVFGVVLGLFFGGGWGGVGSLGVMIGNKMTLLRRCRWEFPNEPWVLCRCLGGQRDYFRGGWV